MHERTWWPAVGYRSGAGENNKLSRNVCEVESETLVISWIKLIRNRKKSGMIHRFQPCQQTNSGPNKHEKEHPKRNTFRV